MGGGVVELVIAAVAAFVVAAKFADAAPYIPPPQRLGTRPVASIPTEDVPVYLEPQRRAGTSPLG